MRRKLALPLVRSLKLARCQPDACQPPAMASGFRRQFRQVLRSARLEPRCLSARSPNLNAYVSSFVRMIGQDCLDRMILFGEASLRDAVEKFVAHYDCGRNRQSLESKIIRPEAATFPLCGRIHR